MLEVPMHFGDSWTSSSEVGDAAISVVCAAAATAGDNNKIYEGGGDDRQRNDGT